MNKFIIPQKNTSLIARYENNAVSVTGKIALPYSSKSVFLPNGLFVSICLGGKPKQRRLKVFDDHGNQLAKKTEYKFLSINHKGNTVYLGGQYRKQGGELFSHMDLNSVDFTADEIELPIKSTEGKSIDDILIRGNTMFLVDNIEFPKYIFTFDITDPNIPRHIGTEVLPNNGTYEHIHRGDINDNYLILFSSTVGIRGANHHITVTPAGETWDKHHLLTFCVSKPYYDRAFPESEEAAPQYFIHDICLLHDRLLVLDKSALYTLDLTKEIVLKNLAHLEPNEAHYTKLIKVNDDACLLVSEESYKHVKL